MCAHTNPLYVLCGLKHFVDFPQHLLCCAFWEWGSCLDTTPTSPTSGVVTRGTSLVSLSVVLLSVSESDSELLSESLELPAPPEPCIAGGDEGEVKSVLK